MPESGTSTKPQLFATTRWSVVLAAKDPSQKEASGALDTLCRTYWPALYCYARAHGNQPMEAEDATQGFFARLLEKNYLSVVQRERGPFRAFLQMAFKRYLSKEREKAEAQFRGGGAVHVQFDMSQAEQIFSEERGTIEADAIFERRWGISVMESAMGALREEYKGNKREQEFEVLKDSLSLERSNIPHAELALKLGCEEGAVRVAVHRLRKRFRELFRKEVAQTVASREDVDAEIQHLIAVLARG